MKKTYLSFLLLLLFCTAVLSGCGGKNKASLGNLCDTLQSDYTCNITFTAKSGTEKVEGECETFHNEKLTSLKIKSPEQLEGLTVEYNTSGVPSSVAVHFKDFDAELPGSALSKINAVASLCANDFVEILRKVSSDKIIEYEITDEESGLLTVVPFGDAEITLCFSKDGNIPYSLEYVSQDMTVSVNISDFRLDIQELTKKIST